MGLHCQGGALQTEGWILRSLVYCASRAIKRGHRPKEVEIRELMELAEIPVPEPSPRGTQGALI